MPHLAPVKDEDVLAQAQSILQDVEKKFGHVPNLFRTMAHAPEVLKGFFELYSATRADLPPRFRELAFLKAARINGCAYLEQLEEGLALDSGLTENQLLALDEFDDSDEFDDREKTILRFAEQLASWTGVDDELATELREFLSESQMVVLASAVGLACYVNTFHRAFNVQAP